MLRMVLVALASLLIAARAEALPPDINFTVYRDGEEIGHHRVSFAEHDGQIVADTDIRLVVTFASVPVFRYEHRSREIWKDGALQSIQSATHDDGDDLRLAAERTPEGLKIDGSRFVGVADGAPTSYWNAGFLTARHFLDTQNGRVFEGRIERIGTEQVTAAGRTIEATRYTFSEALVMDLWYDAQGNWVKTSFTARGSVIDYVLQPPAGVSQ